jgi:hypothetical protein
MRLSLFFLPGILMPVGMLMYGLTAAEVSSTPKSTDRTEYLILVPGYAMDNSLPLVGFVGFAIGGIGDIALTFLQDSYTEILPDALIGVASIRNVMAMVLVFAITPWFNGMVSITLLSFWDEKVSMQIGMNVPCIRYC